MTSFEEELNKLFNYPTPPREDMTITELIENMKHNLKIRKESK